MKSVPLLVVYLNIFSIFSPSWGQPWDNQPDRATGLSPRQKRIIRESWAVFSTYPLGAGRAIMLQYLARYPHYQGLFTTFRHVRVGDLPNNPAFQKLCIAIIYSLNSVVGSLDNPGVLVNTLVALGRDHIRLGVTKQQYVELSQTMIHVLAGALGHRWTPEVRATWVQTLDTINSIIFRAYNY